MDKIEELKAQGYEVVEEFGVDDTMKFVSKQYSFKNLNVYTWTFLIALTVIGFIFGIMVVINMETMYMNVWRAISSIFSGVSLSLLAFLFIMVPIHEMLHGYGFKKCGAKKLKYGFIWSGLAFYCAAHDFVANYKQFRLIGLLPNIIINAILIIALIFIFAFGGSAFWQNLIFLSLCLHITGGMGDMALVGYMYKHKDEGVITYDDLKNMKSYMLIKKKEPQC